MNFLALCKRLRQESGYSGSGPSSVTNQTGESKRVVDWINDAWMDIQNLRSDWRFMLEPFSVSLSIGETVSLPADCKSLLEESVVITRADGSKLFPDVITPEDMRLMKRLRNDPASYPQYISVDSAGLMTVHPACSETVTISGDYYVVPSEMNENTDIPRMPSEHHMAIVWKALMESGAFDESSNTWQRANNRFTSALSSMNGTELPEITVGGPIA